MNPTFLAKLLIFSLITLCHHSHVKSDKIVDSPLLKEIEYKKALLYRKPSPNKTILVTRKKPIRNLKPAYPTRVTFESENAQKEKALKNYMPPVSSNTGNGSQSSFGSVSSKPKNRKVGGGKDMRQTPASDRIFFPPYKFGLWGPGFGGPFGGPFGPGPIGPGPGPIGPFGPGPTLVTGGLPPPIPPPGAPIANAAVPPAGSPPPPASGMAGAPSPYYSYGQPPLNPTGPPPGAYSPGSPVGYRKPSENKPPGRPHATRSKPKPRPRPRTTPMPEMTTDCGCSKHRPQSSYRYESPQQHYGYRRPRPPPTTTTTTPAPCPYHHHAPPSAPQYALANPTQAPYSPPSTPAPAYSQPGPPYSPPSTPPYSPPSTPEPPPSSTAPPSAPYYTPAPPSPPPETPSSTPAPYYPSSSTPAAPPESTTSTTPAPIYYPSTTPTPPPQYPAPPPSQEPMQYTLPSAPPQQYAPSSTTVAPQPPPPSMPPQASPPAYMGWNGWQPPAPVYLNYQPKPPDSPQMWEKMQPQPPAPPPSTKSYQPESSEHLAIYSPPPPPQYNPHQHHHQYSPHHRYPGTRKPCKLKIRPKVPKLFPFEYKPPVPTQPTPPPTPRSKKPCPYKLRAQQAELLQQQLQQQQQYTTPSTTTTTPPPPPLTPPPSPRPTVPPSPPAYEYDHYSGPSYEQEEIEDEGAILYKPNPDEIVHTPTSVTVPLPFPFIMDSNGVLKHKNPGSQQVTYKLDMHPDLITKISTPVVINQSSQNQNPYEPIQQYGRGQTARSGMDRHQISSRHASVASASSPHPQVIVLDSLPKAKRKSPTVILPSGQVVQQPSVVVINSDTGYDYETPDEIVPTIPLSYIQTALKSTPTTSYSSLSDYNYVISEPRRKRTRVKAAPPTQFETASMYQPKSEKSKRLRVNTSDNKNYVIIDKDELEELENSSDDPEEMVRLQVHSLQPEDDEAEDETYTKPHYTVARKHKKRKPQRQSSYVEEPGDSIAAGSNSFSRIFAMNNEGISSIGTPRQVQKPAKRKKNPERLYFDSYIKEVEVDEEDEDDKRK